MTTAGDDSNTVVIEALKEEVNDLHARLDELQERMAVLEERGESKHE